MKKYFSLHPPRDRIFFLEYSQMIFYPLPDYSISFRDKQRAQERVSDMRSKPGPRQFMQIGSMSPTVAILAAQDHYETCGYPSDERGLQRAMSLAAVPAKFIERWSNEGFWNVLDLFCKLFPPAER